MVLSFEREGQAKILVSGGVLYIYLRSTFLGLEPVVESQESPLALAVPCVTS